jgi:hypothetical protein
VKKNLVPFHICGYLLELRIESGNQETHKMLKFCQFGKEKNHHLAKISPKTKALPIMTTKKHKTA